MKKITVTDDKSGALAAAKDYAKKHKLSQVEVITDMESDGQVEFPERDGEVWIFVNDEFVGLS